VDGLEITALPMDRAAWGRLCRLLTLGKRRAEKGQCLLHKADIADWAAGMIMLIHPPDPLAASPDAKRTARDEIAAWARRFSDEVFLAAAPRYDGRDGERLDRLAKLAEATGAPMIATAEPLMHAGRRKALADVLTCIRQGATIDRIGKAAMVNSERRLRSEKEIRRLFTGHGAAVDRAAEVARRCRFRLDELKYEYPDEVSDGEDPQARLERLTWEGLTERYPDGVPPRVENLAQHELVLIGKLGYARYFLTVRDLVAFAEDRGILCQGRGSAANSVVCYALRVTAIGPEIASMVFERFVSEARDEPPDIDVDFEHERREEVIQHIYQRYGRHRAGLCATVIHYRASRAVREVGKAMGLSADAVSTLASQIWGWSSESVRADRIREVGLDPDDPRLAQTLALVEEVIGFPRHLSQHVGGFIMTPAGRALPDRERSHGGPHRHRVGQGRYRRARHPEGRRAVAGHADLHPQGVRPDRTPSRNPLFARDPAARGPRRLRHAVRGGFGRRLSGRKPGADELPAPDAPAQIL